MPTKSAEAEKLYKYVIGGRIQCLVIEACANEGVGANEQVVRRLPGRRPYFHVYLSQGVLTVVQFSTRRPYFS